MPFPQFPLLLTVLIKIKWDKAHVILIAPMWPRETWNPYLMQLAMCPSISLLAILHLLSQDKGRTMHPNLGVLLLKA